MQIFRMMPSRPSAIDVALSNMQQERELAEEIAANKDKKAWIQPLSEIYGPGQGEAIWAALGGTNDVEQSPVQVYRQQPYTEWIAQHAPDIDDLMSNLPEDALKATFDPAATAFEATRYRLQRLGYDPDDPASVQEFQTDYAVEPNGLIGDDTIGSARLAIAPKE